MGGWEQYAGAHWAVIRETVHIRRDRRCSAGRGHNRNSFFDIFGVMCMVFVNNQDGWRRAGISSEA